MKVTNFLKRFAPAIAVFVVLLAALNFGSYDPYNELTVLTPDNAQAMVAGTAAVGEATKSEPANSGGSNINVVCDLRSNVSNNTVTAGGSVTISWTVEGYGPVTLNGNPVANSGSQTFDNIRTNTPYTISASGNNGNCNLKITIICVQPVPPQCVEFRALQPQILVGENTDLLWRTENAVTVTISNVNSNNLPVSGRYTVNPTETTTYVLTATNANGDQDTCTTTITVVVSAPIASCEMFISTDNVNFTTGQVTITQGQPVYVRWTTQNADQVVFTDTSSSGLSRVVGPSGTETFYPTSYTTYVIVVHSANSSGGIPDQKCSVYVEVLPPTTPIVPVCDSFRANPTSIRNGESSTLAWQTTNATSITISGLTGPFPVDGNTDVRPTVTTTYILTATNASGQQVTCPAVVVTVTPVVPNVPYCNSFSATPSELPAGGGNVTLIWNTIYGNSVTITPDIGSVNQRGILEVFVNSTRTYTLTVVGANNQQDTCTVTIKVSTNTQTPICFLQGNYVETLANGRHVVSLTWWTANATNATIQPIFGAVGLSGATTTTVTQNTTFTLTAFGANGQSDICPITVTIPPPVDPVLPVCNSFTADPGTVNKGGTSTLAWSTTNAVRVAIDNGIGQVATSGPLATTEVGNIQQTTTFTLTVFGANNQQDTCTRTVTVNPTTPTPINCTDNVDFTADPSSIRRGNDSTLTWTTTGIDSVRFDNGITSTDPSGSVTVSPNDSTTYNLIATTGSTTISCPVRVSVTTGGGGGGSSSPRCELSISKNKIKSGERVTLTWDSSRATELVIEDQTTRKDIVTTEDLLGDDKDDLFDGTITVSPKKDTTYLMTVSRGSKDRTCKVSVDVSDDIVVNQVRDQQPLVSGISLTQVPYTGFEAGPILTVLFYILLMAWALYIAYLLVIKRDQFGGLALATSKIDSEVPTRFISESVRPEMLSASFIAPAASVATAPVNLPTAVVGYANLGEEKAATVAVDHNVNESEMTQLENYAHSKKVLLSSDAINHFVSTTNSDTERTEALDQVIKAAKEQYPAEDGWVVLNEKRMQDVCLVCQVNAEAVADEEKEYTPAVIPVGSGSLAEAIVTGNIISAYEMIGHRPMFALADAAADLDAVYRIRRGGDGVASEMLMKETAKLSNEQILQMIQALTGAIDGTYTDEAAAVKMSIMKAVKMAS